MMDDIETEEEQLVEDFDNESVLAPTTDYLKELTVLPKYFPKRLRQIYWAYHGKDIMLANLDKEDRIALRNRVGLVVAVAHITQPDYEYTSSQLLDYTNLKHHVQNQGLRGKDGFERVMETQQTRMAISRAETPASLVSPRRQGFLSKVFGGGR